MKLSRLFALFVAFVAVSYSNATSGIVFDRVNSENGLSNNWVRCFYQDESGFLWVGTADGLNRYDGHDLKVYRATIQETNAPIGTTVNSIVKKAPGELWISTDVGLYIYREDCDCLEFYDVVGSKPIFSVLEDSKNRQWFGTRDGLYRRDGELEDPVQIDFDEREDVHLDFDYVNQVFQDSRGRIWVCSKTGVYLYQDTADGSGGFITIGDTAVDVLSIAEDHAGRIWFGMADGFGLNLLQDNGDELYLDTITEGDILGLAVDGENTLWIAGGAGGGMKFLDLDEFVPGQEPLISTVFNDPTDSFSLSGNSIYSVYVDSEDDLWVGSFGSGFNYTSKRFKPFSWIKEGADTISNSLVNSFLDEERYLWIGTEGGLSRLDKETGLYQNFSSNNRNDGKLGTDPVFDIFRDSKGTLWVGNWRGGLNRYVEETDSFVQYLPSDREGSISSSFVFSITEDSRGSLWVGMIEGGICRYDYETDKFVQYSADGGDDQNSHVLDSVNDIIESKDGGMYFSSYGWLNYLDPRTQEITSITHWLEVKNGNNGANITSIFEDSFGVVWIATQSGLELYDPGTGRFTQCALADIADNSVLGIAEDNSGNLWISSSIGITKFERSAHDPRVGKYRSISYGYGIVGSEFKKRAIHLALDGRIYLGTSKGYLSIDPSEVVFNEKEPTVVLSEVSQLVESPNSPYEYKPVELSRIENNSLSVSYKHADLSFQFSVLNFLNPEANRYRYRLVGYDSTWIEPGNVNVATYTSIDPGEYTFEVMGANNDGVWSREPLRFGIKVIPPWWGTIWFRLMIVFVLAVLIVIGYRVRVRILRNQQIILSGLVKKRTADLEDANAQLAVKQTLIETRNLELAKHKEGLEAMIASRTKELESAMKKAERSDHLKSAFLANLSHEIRTPMNAIVGFSSLLKSPDFEPDERDSFVDIIDDNCQSLLVLIDDILDLSMIESDQLEVVSKEVNVDEILKGLYSVYELKNENNIEFRLTLDDSAGPLIIESDPVRMKQVVSNLLSNAFKFTEEGSVEFGYERIGGAVKFFVKDTGVGVSRENLMRIFDRFHKIEDDDGQLFRGTGLGLAISSKIVDLLGGKISVESVLGEGAEFTFTIPVSGLVPHTEEVDTSIHSSHFDFSKIEILVAEDEENNFQLLRYLMERAGAKVYRAFNGEDAIAFIEKGGYSTDLIILMDLKMPGIDGYAARDRIHEIDSSIPIIAQTAFAQRDDRQRVLDAGFNGYVSKPISETDLFEVIENVVMYG